MACCRSTSSMVKSREFIDNSDDFEEDASANSVTDLTHDNNTESEDDNDKIQSQPSTDFTMDPKIAAELKQRREEDVKKFKEALKKAEKKRRADKKKRKADISTSSSPKTPAQPCKKGRKSDEIDKRVLPKDLNLSVSLQLYMYLEYILKRKKIT
ncbi:hypothetical protein BDP27DRAFT_1432422 [Rhodocollybia butyracea]|uniref:Uncharacterized protein n=1 Tax=Rhodocollybia butyracea TaxID=206335 RepID=A0A9P5PAP3_9AGAR|nr:hypothetical protein BDP27DRAFT_1432422 [Rhodocollybia butyracea]